MTPRNQCAIRQSYCFYFCVRSSTVVPTKFRRLQRFYNECWHRRHRTRMTSSYTNDVIAHQWCHRTPMMSSHIHDVITHQWRHRIPMTSSHTHTNDVITLQWLHHTTRMSSHSNDVIRHQWRHHTPITSSHKNDVSVHSSSMCVYIIRSSLFLSLRIDLILSRHVQIDTLCQHREGESVSTATYVNIQL